MSESMVPHSVMISQIDAAVFSVYEECARIADKLGDKAWSIYKGRCPDADFMLLGASHTEGQADAGHEIAALIRGQAARLKERQNSPSVPPEPESVDSNEA